MNNGNGAHENGGVLNGSKKIVADFILWGIRAIAVGVVAVGWRWCGKVETKLEAVNEKMADRDIAFVRIEGHLATQAVAVDKQAGVLDRQADRLETMAIAIRDLTAQSMENTGKALDMIARERAMP